MALRINSKYYYTKYINKHKWDEETGKCREITPK